MFFSKISDESNLRPILLGLCKEWRIVNLNFSTEWAVWCGKGWNWRRIRKSPNRTASDCLHPNGLVMARNLTLMNRRRAKAEVETKENMKLSIHISNIEFCCLQLKTFVQFSHTFANVYEPQSQMDLMFKMWNGFPAIFLGMFPEKLSYLI